jgi:exodeoxyribonuclease-3
MMRIISWNVNGLRAIYNKDFLLWFDKEKPTILCLQEIKAHEQQLPDDLKNISSYHSYFSSAQKKGYSGVALYSKVEPDSVRRSFGVRKFDAEGRCLIADYGPLVLCNVYFPNGKASPERLTYKMAFYSAFLKYIDKLAKANKHIIICGDVNTAHQEIDLARPKANRKVSGFLPQERAWIDRLLEHGFIDTFRVFNEKPGNYTWWDYKTRARERDVGWRLDYFFISNDLKTHLISACIMKHVMGSDHCPVGIDLKINLSEA